MAHSIERRTFIKVAGAFGVAAATPGFLAGCSDASTVQSANSATGSAEVTDTTESADSANSAISSDTDNPTNTTSPTDASDSTAAASTSDAETNSPTPEEDVVPNTEATPQENSQETNNALVLIYSRADENYNVGYIETGNTMVLAQFIQQKTGADLFELKPETPYPAEYNPCIDQALEEQHRGDRPALQELPDLTSYNTIYFGFPCWWGDIPMPVYTAIEALDWQGKTIAPFNTHEGSGNAGMFTTLAQVCAGSTVLDGLTVQGSIAQNQRDTAEQRVDEWLENLGL